MILARQDGEHLAGDCLGRGRMRAEDAGQEARIDAGGLGTYFSCTSTDAATMQVGVELFASPGGAPSNDAAATSLSVRRVASRRERRIEPSAARIVLALSL